MKHLLLIACLFAGTATFAQKGKEFKASNGTIYHVGDTVTLTKGSGTDGKFLSLGLTGLRAIATYNSNNPNAGDQLAANRGFNGGKGIIKKIKEMNFAGSKKPYFVLDFKSQGNYMLLIEDAISYKEIN